MPPPPPHDLLAPASEFAKWERISVVIFDSARAGAVRVAAEIAQLIRQRADEKRPAVLGLATGSTPIFVYQELVRLHRKEGLSFRNVITFNLDEYHPMPPDQPQSYHHFMREHLFDHIDIDAKNIHIPDGTVPRAQAAASCQQYEKQIADAGGIDLQLLGIGRTGHIGFNEPGSPRRSVTRFINLDRLTRLDAVKDFQSEDRVPRTALTMGVKTILQARRVILMAFGEHKAAIVARAVEGEVAAAVPATYLQDHDNCVMVLDQAAAGQLTRIRTPWVVGPLAEMELAWSDRMLRRAVTWLAAQTGKAVLKLTDEDYNSHMLQELLSEYGNAYEINLLVFRQLQNTITGWPGGKPAHADGQPVSQPKPLLGAAAAVYPKRILIFSPHPGDGVCSIGGTITRLAAHGHELHLAYQTSGSVKVKDEVMERYVDFYQNADPLHPPEVVPGGLRAKGAIRRAEARMAAQVCGVSPERLHFLDLPFYEASPAGHRHFTPRDVALTVQLLREIRPHQIYAAGDLADPQGTHRLCQEIMELAWREVAVDDWRASCEAWLYRGSWSEWAIHEVDLAVPLSPSEVACKRRAVAQHESQRHQFPGGENATDHAHANSRLFDALGLADYEAIETFHRWSV